MAQPRNRPTTSTPTTIVSKSSGKVVDKKRSLAAQKAAATRKANQQTQQRNALRLHHKILAIGGILGVVVLTFLAINYQLQVFAATKSAQGLVHNGGQCMDNQGGEKKNGNTIRVYSCNASNAQAWRINDGNIINDNGYCVDTAGTNPKAGDQTRLNQCSKSGEMQFSYKNNTLVNYKSKLCLESKGGKGDAIYLAKCNGGGNQKWTLKNVTVTTADPKKEEPAKAAPKKEEPKKSNLSAKQQLAHDIMKTGKLSFVGASGVSAATQKKIFSDIANGSKSGNDLPCGINIKVLKVLKRLVDNHKSVQISDSNSLCTNTNIRSLGSRHYGGNGSALDITQLDGSKINGSNAKTIAMLKELKSLFSTGSSLHSRSQIGQSNCRKHIDLGNVSQISDNCSHQHIDFPPWEDSSLKHKSYAY